MAKEKVYLVCANPKGGWEIRKEGNKKATAKFETKDKAVARGKELAKQGKGPGQLTVYKKDGTVQATHKY